MFCVVRIEFMTNSAHYIETGLSRSYDTSAAKCGILRRKCEKVRCGLYAHACEVWTGMSAGGMWAVCACVQGVDCRECRWHVGCICMPARCGLA